jgi:hypothetical protein
MPNKTVIENSKGFWPTVKANTQLHLKYRNEEKLTEHWTLNTVSQIDFKGFWRWYMTFRTTEFLDFLIEASSF